ncbi:DUF1571 domain-containing protein [Ralstonia syzygii]|uniref:DUF1571 domain-containing protein n=1 Tax=Ralstonia syzygii TaxID=28097 RepID=A0ABX7ZHX8_9RALS|nr:DUF1571 domain-containing protein [Ralstonia syzygii]QUP54880.1 DUF1571 domain-containing protein [Ralstonia syzygii]
MQIRPLAAATVLAWAACAWTQPRAEPDGDAAVPAAAASPSAVAASFAAMDTAAQAAWLGAHVRDGSLAGWSDEAVLAMARAMKPDTLVRWLRTEVAGLSEYEYRMHRQERVKDRWQSQPSIMDIRYRHAPRQVYVRWLEGGTHAGQEIIYDETVRQGEMFGHLGGLLGFATIWSALDGPIVRSQSNHTARELGLQFIVDTLERDGRAYAAAGHIAKFDEARIVTEDGVRMLQLTWDAPGGPPAFYAKRVRLYFDLRHPWVRAEEAWDESGRQLEKIVIDNVTRKTWNDQTFNPKNPEYKF